MEWQQKRKALYVFGFVLAVVLILAYPVYKLANPVATCFDKKQNGTEVGVDCGGGCNLYCSSQITPLRVVWAKAFPGANDYYDLGAYIENPNAAAGLKNAHYVMQMVGTSGNVLGEAKGTVEIAPSGTIILFAPNLKSSEKPAQVSVSFDEADLAQWVKARPGQLALTVKNQTLKNTDTKPRLDAVLVNNDQTNPSGYVDLNAIIYDSERNPVAISRTYSTGIDAGGEEKIFFTWQNRLTKNPRGGMCATPVDTMLVFDRSGSMKEGTTNPPEPLTTAKNAAMSYAGFAELADRVGLVSFASEATKNHALSNDTESVKRAISDISILSTGLQYTNLGDALKLASEELQGAVRPDVKRVIVALTDGVANRPLDPKNAKNTAYAEEYAGMIAGNAKTQGVEIYTIGLGSSFNEDFLKDKIATNAAHYFKAGEATDLQGIYKKISETMCKEEGFIKEVIITPKAVFNR